MKAIIELESLAGRGRSSGRPLFESPSLARMGPGTSSGPGAPIRPYPETVIPSTVRRINTFTIPGVGPIQYWVADTKQNGICTALRLLNGDWDGLQNDGRVAGSMPGCRPTRKQLSGGALILDGFDYEQTSVTGTNGKSRAIQYGAVTARDAAQVRETVNGVNAPIIDGQYFAIALQPASRDWGDTGRLEAISASGQPVAEEGKSLPGTVG